MPHKTHNHKFKQDWLYANPVWISCLLRTSLSFFLRLIASIYKIVHSLLPIYSQMNIVLQVMWDHLQKHKHTQELSFWFTLDSANTSVTPTVAHKLPVIVILEIILNKVAKPTLFPLFIFFIRISPISLIFQVYRSNFISFSNKSYIYRTSLPAAIHSSY